MSNASFLATKNLHLFKKIGEGTFSKVYLVKYGEIVNEKLLLIATKIINKNRVSHKFIEKFLPRELDMLIKLRHPYIIKVYSIYKYGYKIFINMEYAENGDLYTYLQSNTLTEPQIRMWTMQILWAFRYMHTAGVVHRDMKCENVLLTGNFNVRIADFGFTRFVGRGRNPGADTVCGTLAYSAPELLAGTKPYNPMAVDVWAIGVVVFMMANNVAPFRDKFKEDMYKKQVTKHFGFRKVLGRSDYLKRFTAMFLEPNVQERVQIKNALQSYFIKIGNVKTPSKVQNTATEENNHISTVPIINEVTMKSSSFTYQISGNVKSISFFNTEFIPVEDSEAGIFRED